MTDQTSTRRRVIQAAVGAATTTVIAPEFIDVASADTASGNVELETTATVPADTSIEITIYEDTSGDGTADRQQTNEIPDGTTTTEYDLLESTTAQGDVLWLEVALSTSDDTTTPSLDSATITLPATSTTPEPTQEPAEEAPQESLGIFEMWQDYRVFVAALTLSYAGIGLWSKSLTIAAWSGYIAFLYVSFTAGSVLFENIALATLVLVFLGFAFKLVRLEFEGEA